MSIYNYSLHQNDTGVSLSIKNLEDHQEERIDLGEIISNKHDKLTQDYFSMIYCADLILKGTLQSLDTVTDIYGRTFVVMQMDKRAMSS